MTRPVLRRAASALIAGGVILLASATPTFALPGNDVDDMGPAYFPSAAYDYSNVNRNAATKRLDLQRGLYVIGDSLSTSPGSPRTLNDTPDTSGGSTRVEYARFAQTSLAHNKVAVRAFPGFTTADHLNETQWPSNKTGTSLDDIAASNASTVFVELGTNDVSCMHRSQFMPGGPYFTDKASLDCDTYKTKDGAFVTPPDDASYYGWWRDLTRDTIKRQTTAVINKLLGGGRCVIWAGPREVDIYGSRAEDYRWFNDFLKTFASNPKFHYANLSLYATSDKPLNDDWSKHWSTGGGYTSLNVHPQTSAGADSIAKFASLAAKLPPTAPSSNPMFPTGGCGIDS